MPVMPDKEFRDFLSQGRFMIQCSRTSGKYIFPPRVIEPGTGCPDLEWKEVSGKGSIYSITYVARRNPADSYNVALVDLVEGPRLLTRIEEAASGDAYIGRAVRARIIDEGSDKVLVFVPDDERQQDRGESLT